MLFTYNKFIKGSSIYIASYIYLIYILIVKNSKII